MFILCTEDNCRMHCDKTDPIRWTECKESLIIKVKDISLALFERENKSVSCVNGFLDGSYLFYVGIRQKGSLLGIEIVF